MPTAHCTSYICACLPMAPHLSRKLLITNRLLHLGLHWVTGRSNNSGLRKDYKLLVNDSDDDANLGTKQSALTVTMSLWPACVDFRRAFLMSSSVLLLSLISSCCVFTSKSFCLSARALRAYRYEISPSQRHYKTSNYPHIEFAFIQPYHYYISVLYFLSFCWIWCMLPSEQNSISHGKNNNATREAAHWWVQPSTSPNHLLRMSESGHRYSKTR